MKLKWSVIALDSRPFFIYNQTMNTDFLIDLQLLGMSRTEAVMLLDELLDDGEEMVLLYIKAKRGERCIKNTIQTQLAEKSVIAQ